MRGASTTRVASCLFWLCFCTRPAVGAKPWAPSRRHSPRGAPPTEERATCATQRHARAQFVGAPPSGRSFGRRAAGRASYRNACDLRNAAPCTGSICWSPAVGAKLFGHRAGAIRRGARLPQKSVRPAQRSAMHGLNLWQPRPRGEAFGHRAGAIRRGSRLPQKMRATRAMRCHALTAFVGGPPSGRSFSGAEPAPFAAGRGSHRQARDRHDAAPCTGSICGRPALGAKLLGTEPAPFAAGRASHRKVRDLPNAAPCTGSICGRPALGAKLLGTEPAPFAAGRASHRRACDLRNAAPCTGSICGRPSGRSFSGSEPAPFAAGRGSYRKSASLHKATPCTDCFCRSPALGAKLWAPSRRHSPRVAPPTEKRASCTTQRHARAQFVGGPPSGRSCSSTEPVPFAAGRGSHRNACHPRNAASCTDRFCGRAALGAKLFGHRAGAIRRGSRLPQKSMRAAQRSAMHGLNLWEARPRGEAFGHRAGAILRGSRLPQKMRAPAQCGVMHRPPAKKSRRRGSAGQCGGYCDSTSVTAWRNTPVRSCGLPGSSRSIRSELPRQTSLPSFAS